MGSARLLPTVAVAALLVLAGCGGVPLGESSDTTPSPTVNGTEKPPSSVETGTPQSGQGPEPNATGPSTPGESVSVEYAVTVENGTLPVNATLTYARVQALTGTDVRPWPVNVSNLSEWRSSVQRVGASPLNRALGFQNLSANWTEPTGLTAFGTVFIHPGDGAPAKTERVLAHEYAHLVQYRTAMLPWQGQLTQSRLTTDLVKTRRSLIEGGAVYVADAYADRYLKIQNNSAYARDLYRDGSATRRSALAPYVFGSRYVGQRIDDPANLSAAYESYPRTTEQLIHNETPAEEPPATLDVTANETDRWEHTGNNTLGELTTRNALDTALGRERAAAAASGWGTDRLVIYQNATNGSRYGWAWVMRWDNETETDELQRSLSAYASAREANASTAFRVERLGNETVVLVFGAPEFVAAAEVDTTAGNVTVSPAGQTGA